jgi:hypothetical protein
LGALELTAGEREVSKVRVERDPRQTVRAQGFVKYLLSPCQLALRVVVAAKRGQRRAQVRA